MVGSKYNKNVLAGALLLAMIAGTGCSTTQSTEIALPRSEQTRDQGETMAARPAPAPAPAPVKATPAPASAPAPAAAPMASTNAIFLPTGVRGTSVLMVERMMPAQVVAGQEFEYSYRVTNLTQNALSGVALTDTIGAPFVFSSSNPNPSSQQGANFLWNLGDFRGNEVKNVVVKGRAQGAGQGMITSCASASWNQTLCGQVAIVSPALKVDLVMPAQKTLCEQVCGTVTITNTGTGEVRNAKVTLNVPAGFSLVGANTFDAGTLGAGQSRQFNFCGKAERTGAVALTAAGMGEPGLTAAAAPTNTTIVQPVLALAAECPSGTFLMGRNATVKFTARNTSNTDSANTMLMVTVPAGVQVVSSDMGGTAAAGGVNWNLGSLKANESRTVSVVIRTGGMGDIPLAATLRGDCAEARTANCVIKTIGVPDIGTLLTDDDGVVEIGKPHVFRYEMKNQGQIPLTNVKVIATLGDGLEFSAANAPGGAPRNLGGGKFEFSLGTVPVNGKVVFNITGIGRKEGVLTINTETTSTETPKPNMASEQVNYIAP